MPASSDELLERITVALEGINTKLGTIIASAGGTKGLTKGSGSAKKGSGRAPLGDPVECTVTRVAEPDKDGRPYKFTLTDAHGRSFEAVAWDKPIAKQAMEFEETGETVEAIINMQEKDGRMNTYLNGIRATTGGQIQRPTPPPDDEVPF